jgi:hypothetical protein
VAEKAPAPEREPVADAMRSIDAQQVWSELRGRVPARGFLRTLVDSLGAIGPEGRSFVLGYSPDQKSAIETLATTSNRRQLETLLKEITGHEWSLKLQSKEGMEPKNEEVSASNSGDAYKDDPLIQEALEMFKGQIKS